MNWKYRYTAWPFRTTTLSHLKGIIYCQTGYASLVARLVAHPLGSLRPRLPSELLSFGHRETAHARLGPSKVPQPGVDLVNMAAPPQGWACTIGTAELKASFRRLYLCAIVEVAFPSKKHGMSGTLPKSAEEVLPT
jgi:hypothetical protein